jgi:hypothetical protein
MDRSGDWEPGVPERRAWTQGPWHGAPADEGPGGQGTRERDAWQAGAGYPNGDGGMFPGEWAVSTVDVQRLRRRVVRFLAVSALTGIALIAAFVALAVVLFQHGGVLALLLGLIVVPVVLLGLAAAAAIWIGRRAWRSGAWLEAVPAAAGMPWLSRVVWALRAALVSRAFWRLGRRTRRPRYQRRTGDLSGTTR